MKVVLQNALYKAKFFSSKSFIFLNIMQTGVLNFEQLHASQARQNESLPRKLTSNSLYFFLNCS